MATMVPEPTDTQDENRWQDDREFWVDQLESAKADRDHFEMRLDEAEMDVGHCELEIERIDALAAEDGAA